MVTFPSLALLNKLAKAFAILLHFSGLGLFFMLLTVSQHPEQRAQFPHLINANNLYALPYNFGELIALVGLLSISIPTLLQLHDNECEAISPERMVSLALMLVFIGVAFAIRTPIPPSYADNVGVGYLVLSPTLQLSSTYLIGMFTALLGFLAILRVWPRTVIVLLMMCLLYFSSGNLLFNVQLKDHNALLGLMSAFTFLMILLGCLSLWMLRPQIEEDFEQVKVLRSLKKRLKEREKELSDSEIANILISLTPDGKPKEDPKKVLLVNLPTAPTDSSAPTGLLEEAQRTREALKALREDMNELRQEQRQAEKEKLAKLAAAIDDLHARVNRMLIEKTAN